MYVPPHDSHKGQNGRILIIAGSKKYHGSALLAIKASIPFVDIVYYYPPQLDNFLINAVKNIPEVIIVYDYKPLLKKIDSLLIGPGLGGLYFNLGEFKGIKRVIDGEGLKLVKKGYLDKKALLTPHRWELKYYLGGKADKDYLLWLAKQLNTNILAKGHIDYLTNGEIIIENMLGNAGMTKGGTGDALAGFITALSAKNDIFEAAKIGVEAFCKAADLCFEEKGFYYTPSDIIKKLPYVMKQYVQR